MDDEVGVACAGAGREGGWRLGGLSGRGGGFTELGNGVLFSGAGISENI